MEPPGNRRATFCGEPLPFSHPITADGVTLAHAVTGSGPTPIHLPWVPFGNVLAEWRVPSANQAYRTLFDHLRLVWYDGRGTGRSQRDVDDITPETMIRDLEAVGVHQFALLGLYVSCSVAVAYAARHPERVTSMVLFGGALHFWDLLGVGGDGVGTSGRTARVIDGSGAAGLPLGLAVPVVGLAAAAGVTLFFVGAIITHVRARWGLPAPMPFFVMAVAALALKAISLQS